MKQWQIIAFGGVLAIISGIAGYQLQQHQNAEDSPAQDVVVEKRATADSVLNTKIENFILPDVDGVQRNLSEWQGKVIVINFWATWCPPCREEIPDFIELQTQYSDRGLQFIGIALQEAEEIRDFIAEFDVNYPSLVGTDKVIQVANKLGNGIGALPYTVIIDRHGIISFTRRGPLSKSDAETAIQPLL